MQNHHLSQQSTILFFIITILFSLSSCHPKVNTRQKAQDILTLYNNYLNGIYEDSIFPNKEQETDEDNEWYKRQRALDHIYEEITDWILTDTGTFSYDFCRFREESIMTAHTSPDGNLRIYTWDTGRGGTMICWDNIIQLRENGKIKAYHSSLYHHCFPDDPDYEPENDYASAVVGITQHTLGKGKTLYMVENNFREWSNMSYSSLEAYAIQNGRLAPQEVFHKDNETTYYIGMEHTNSDWYFNANYGEGWDWLFRFNPADSCIYAMREEENRLLDRYDTYRLTNGQFIYQSEKGPFWLHPSVRHFRQLAVLFQVKGFRIRIDNIDNGTFRYTAWNSNQLMSDKPELVIQEGKMKNDAFIFHNGAFTYKVSIREDEYRLIVYKGSKIVLDRTQIKPE